MQHALRALEPHLPVLGQDLTKLDDEQVQDWDQFILRFTKLQDALIAKASEYSDAPAPGFTHMQHAQPVLFGHELAKHVHAFARDLDRIQDWLTRTSVSPLGSGALAGSGLGLAPEVTAQDLGFTNSSANSIDGVSDRDFVAEALFIISMVGIHL